MEKEIIKNAIIENNPWWKEGHEFEEIRERGIYEKIKKFLGSRQIIALTGLRRVGKTTLMKKMIKDFLGKGTKSENIFYFSFDEFSEERMREILRLYEELHGKNLRKEKVVCFLDEIQKVENWQEQLKRIYDDFPKIKFVISGSESLFIKNKGKESLAGRIYEFKIELLSFKEYLDFKEIDYKKTDLNKERIKGELKNYLRSGGFPELVFEANEQANLYIKSVIDKVIDGDMPKVFDIKNPSEVRDVFNRIYNDPGQIIEIQELGKELNMDRNKTSYILDCLEKSFMIKKLYNFSTNSRKVQRKLKKYYSFLINPYIIDSNFGGVFESFLVFSLGAEYFWRDSFKNEVDIVLFEKGKNPEGIEVKSGNIRKESLSSMESFLKTFNLSKGKAKIVSYEKKEEKEGFRIIPFYEILFK